MKSALQIDPDLINVFKTSGALKLNEVCVLRHAVIVHSDCLRGLFAVAKNLKTILFGYRQG